MGMVVEEKEDQANSNSELTLHDLCPCAYFLILTIL